MRSKSKGKRGEELARKHYEANGYEVLECNYRYKRAEIDLILLLENELLIFVEVKSRNSLKYGEPETFVSEEQQERIKEAAEDYIDAINWKKDIRFDIVAIDRGEINMFVDAF